MPERITRMTRSERCRPSQAMRGSACGLVRPSVSTTPDIADTALAKPASSAIAICRRRQRAHPTLKKIIQLRFFGSISDMEALLLAIHHKADAILTRNHRFKRKPPGLAETVRKRRRHINGEGNAVLRQQRIG